MKTVLLGVTGGGGARMMKAGEVFTIEKPTLVVQKGGRISTKGAGRTERLVDEMSNFQADIHHPPKTLTCESTPVYLAPLD